MTASARSWRISAMAMAQSAATLAMVPAGADIGVEVDLRKLGIDLDEDGKITPQESAAAIMAALSNNSGDAPDATARWSSASTAPTAIGCRAMPIS